MTSAQDFARADRVPEPWEEYLIAANPPVAATPSNPWSTVLGITWMALLVLAVLLTLIGLANLGGAVPAYKTAGYNVADISFISATIAAAFGLLAALLHVAVKAVQWKPGSVGTDNAQ